MKSLSFIFSIILGITLLGTGILSVTPLVSAEILDMENLEHTITGGTISSIESDVLFSSLILTIDTNSSGQLTITLPRALIDSTLGGVDDEFFVLTDGQEVIYDEILTTSESRTFMILFEDGTEEIEIIGTILDVSALTVYAMEETFDEETIELMDETVVENTEGGGCLIATAAYGSEMSPQVQLLREIRDNQLMNTESGTAFISTFNNVYYSFSPIIADMQRDSPMLKEIVKVGLTPMISSLSLMESANSESEVLGLGLSVIALNLGMYLGVPAVVIVGIRKRI
jgi:hypothetical protein